MTENTPKAEMRGQEQRLNPDAQAFFPLLAQDPGFQQCCEDLTLKPCGLATSEEYRLAFAKARQKLAEASQAVEEDATARALLKEGNDAMKAVRDLMLEEVTVQKKSKRLLQRTTTKLEAVVDALERLHGDLQNGAVDFANARKNAIAKQKAQALADKSRGKDLLEAFETQRKPLLDAAKTRFETAVACACNNERIITFMQAKKEQAELIAGCQNLRKSLRSKLNELECSHDRKSQASQAKIRELKAEISALKAVQAAAYANL
ncbi:MAG: hypothetical protein K6G15_11480 [Desulfovibrio sp.]|nr:hypothetical protein [Desulfovibrio sp.]